jgi:hypothetical protein
MKNFFRKYEEASLVVLALLLVAFIVIYFAWGIGYVVSETDNALDAQGVVAQNGGFNLTGAQMLNLHGLVSQ